MFPMLYDEYDCNTICHKNFMTIHPLVYRLGYLEVIVSITLGNHKAIMLLLLHYQCIYHCTCK